MVPEKVKSCRPDQWRDISQHQDRATHVFQQAYLNDAFNTTDSLTLYETRLAISLHDVGKALVPNHIHEATKDPKQQAYYDLIYRFHPAKTLAVLGKQFIQEHPLAARLIYFHHPDQPIVTKKYFLGLAPTPPQTKPFKWGLAVLIVADGITAGWEIRYGRSQPDTPENTVKILQSKLNQNGLTGFVDIPKAVTVGYQALNALRI